MALRGCMINKETVRAAQHDDQIIWRVPVAAEIGIPGFHEETSLHYITLHYT